MNHRSNALVGALGALALLAAPHFAQSSGGSSGGSTGPGTPPGGPTDTGTAGGHYGGPGDTTPSNPLGGTGGAPGSLPGAPNPGGLPGGPAGLGGGYAPGVGGPPPEAYPGLTDPQGPESEEPGARPLVEDTSSWQLWWHYNRWVYLDPEFGARETTTGSGGFFLGRGQTEMVADPLAPSPEVMRDLVVPALPEALGNDAGNEMRVHGLQALAKMRKIKPEKPEHAFTRVASRFLTSSVSPVAEKAILSLGVRGDATFFGKLHGTLHDETDGRAWLGKSQISPRTQVFAAYALGLMGERHKTVGLRRRIHASLLRGLASDRQEVQAACALSISLVPLPFFDETGEELHAESGEGHTRLDQLNQLLAFLEDAEQPAVARAQVPTTLAKLVEGTPEAMRERVILDLVARIGARVDEPREVQAAAVMALGRLVRSGAEAIDRVARNELARIAYRSHGDRLTRYLAMVSLARSASRAGEGKRSLEGLEPTRRLLQRNLSLQRGQALGWTAIALGLLEGGAVDCGEVPSSNSSQRLREMLERQRSDEVVGAVAVALGIMRDPEAEEILLETMRESGHPRIRGYCGLALGMIGARTRVTELRAALEASVGAAFPVEQIAIALALLGDQGLGLRLCDILEEASNPVVQASVASAMGWIRDPRPLERLCARLSAEGVGDAPRAWTAVALGRICDSDDWPWVARLSVDVPYDITLPTLIDPEFGTGLLDLH